MGNSPDVEPSLLHELLASRAEEHPQRPFVLTRDSTLSYGQMWDQAQALSRALMALGIRPGDRVAVMCRNAPGFVASIFGISAADAVLVPVNTAYKRSLLHHVLQDSGAKLALVDDESLQVVDEIRGELPALEHVIELTGEAEAGANLWRQEVNAPGLAMPPAGLPDPYSALQSIMYTSGTSGPSKGVLVMHRHTLRFAADYIHAVGLTADDVTYEPLPLFHAIGHTLGVVATALAGAQIALVDRFSARRYWREVQAFDATIGHGIHGMVPILLNQPRADHDRAHRLRVFYNGYSAMAADFKQRFGAEVIEAYGATENGMVSFTDPADPVPGSCGKVNRTTFEIAIADDDDVELPRGKVGEILVRPRVPNALTPGYLNRHTETLECFRNLWFHSGDLGRLDENDNLYFVDRKKDSLRRRGENISSFEVEQVINAHPDVLDCAVIGVPSPLGEQEVKACVVIAPESPLKPNDLHSFLVADLPKFMVPRYIEFLEVLPKTPTEKVLKHELRAHGVLGMTGRTWDAGSLHVPG